MILFTEITGAFTRVVDMVGKYGSNKVAQGFFIILAFILANGILNEFQIPSLLSNYQNSQLEQHEKGNAKRAEADPIIQQELLKNIIGLNCDRAYILELHNGTNNPTGLPFRYCEMTYEQVSDSVDDITDQYKQVNMSRYPLFSYLYEKHVFIGSIDELDKIDHKMASQMRNDGVKYMAFKVMMTNTTPIGILGISFCKDVYMTDKFKENIFSTLTTSGDKCCELLDEKNHIDNSFFKKLFGIN